MSAYRFQLRRVDTGETRVYTMNMDGGGSVCDFWWTEGNMSCHCNKHLYWLRASGMGEREIAERTRGDQCTDEVFVYDWVEFDGVRFIEAE